MNDCPSLATLEQAFTALLGEEIDDLGDSALVAHVEGCGTCQSRLEALVSESACLSIVESQHDADWDPRLHSVEQFTVIQSDLSSEFAPSAGPLIEGTSLPEVPGYEILARLDRGGMGVVYKARHQKLNRLVALKMILAGEYAAADKFLRFDQEAETVARLRHPNIVEIYDIGMAQGVPYIALEYMSGGSLEQLFRQGPQPPRRSAELLATLAQAIHTAHLAGIIHRDLKPANVLLSEDGTAKIADFGVAKRREAVGQTQTGQIIGTPAYMAPEQARGESKNVGPAADVYSLGAILYEALTGRPPFRSQTVMQTLQRVVSDEPAPPRKLVPSVPADLETVCLKALRKEPKERYATAQELADELDRFLHDEPVRARPLTRMEKVYRWCRRKPTLAGLLAATTALMLMAGLAILLAFDQRELRQAQERTQKAWAGEQDARRKEKRHLYVHDIYRTDRFFQGNQLFQARRLLEACDADQRGWEWHYLDRITSADLLSLTGHTQPVHTLAFAPQRPLLVSGSGDGTLAFWEPGAAKRLLKLPGESGPVWDLAFSPDGRCLASVAGSSRESGALIVWELGTGSELKPHAASRIRLNERLGERAALGYHPCKPLLAVATGLRAGQASGLLLLDAHGEEVRRWPAGAEQGCVALAWSRDGRRLAASLIPAERQGTKGEVIVVDPDKTETLYRFEANRGRCAALAFSPDGRTLACGGGDGLIELRDTDDFTLRKMCCGHIGSVNSVAFRSDGQLISGGTDSTVRVWDRWSGQEMFVGRGHFGPVRRVAIQPKTGRIYSGSDDVTIKAWQAEKSQESEAYRLHKGAATALAFSPDGAALVSVGLDGAVWRIDPTGGERPRLLLHERRPLRQVRFLPSSQTLLVAGDGEKPGQEDGAIRLVDARDGRVSAELDTQMASVCSLSVSGDGRRLSVVGRTREQGAVVQLWDMTATPPRCNVIPPALLPGTAVAAQLFSGGNKLVVLLAQVNNFLKPGYVLLDVSQSPRLLAGTRSAINRPCFAVFNRDESLLFMGGQDQGFNKFQVSPRGFFDLARYSGHTGAIHNGALSPDETLFATASEDGTLRIWDRKTDQELLVLCGDAGPMNDVAFSPRGGFLAAAQDSGVIRVWDGRPRSGSRNLAVSSR